MINFKSWLVKKRIAAIVILSLFSCQQQVPQYNNDYHSLKEEVANLNTRIDSLISALQPKPVVTNKKSSKKKALAKKPVPAATTSDPVSLPAYESSSSSSRTTYESSSSYSGRCQATTKKGTQCKRSASSGSNYCWQHWGNTATNKRFRESSGGLNKQKSNRVWDLLERIYSLKTLLRP